MNIVLIGYRCTGKTSVGMKLAARLGRAFHDTDQLIQERAGRTVREIVDADGWETFRAEERKTVAMLALQDGCVVALGGGAVLDQANVAAMKANGRVVWLMADLETILARMADDVETAGQRPPLQGRDSAEETALVLEERTPIYEAAADVAVNTEGRSVEEIVAEICGLLAAASISAGL